MASKQPKLIVAMSDPHFGSTYGLLQPSFITHEGEEIRQNPRQKWLWEAFTDCRGWMRGVIGKDPWSVVLNGDLIDGNHHGTKEIWSVDESDHMEAAAEVMTDFCKGAHSVYLTEGTESHTKGMEHAIAKIMRGNGINVVSPSTKHGAWDALDLKCNGALIEVDHHMPTTTRPYLEASMLSIVLGARRVESSRAGLEVPKVIVRSHRHRFGLYEDGYGMMVALPAWQGLTRYGRKVVTRAVPQVGIVILDFRNVEPGGTPAVHKRLHTIKQAPPVTL